MELQISCVIATIADRLTGQTNSAIHLVWVGYSFANQNVGLVLKELGISV